MSEKRSELIKRIEQKFKDIGQDPDIHLEGLLHSKTITYWDYIQTDALLNLQIPRTDQPDEMIFIMYHQINELLFKMILWEIDQVADLKQPDPSVFSMRLNRVSRYFDMLGSSFNIMGEGMEVDQYMKFRTTLTPASGFQSYQYRLIEFASTELINLIDNRFRGSIDRDSPFENAYDHLYWQAAGKNHESGEKSTLISQFENRYMEDFIVFMKKYNESNLWTKFKGLPDPVKQDQNLIKSMRHYDHTVNVSWVMAHYEAAAKYLDSGEESAEATGGSDWKKYMHPKYQKRIFFPDLWTSKELEGWGITNLEGHS